MARTYRDRDGRLYFVAASHDGQRFKTICHNPAQDETYWLVSVWRDSFQRAQEDLDRVARANGWREVKAK